MKFLKLCKKLALERSVSATISSPSTSSGILQVNVTAIGLVWQVSCKAVHDLPADPDLAYIEVSKMCCAKEPGTNEENANSKSDSDMLECLASLFQREVEETSLKFQHQFSILHQLNLMLLVDYDFIHFNRQHASPLIIGFSLKDNQ
ncbi:hypothetical protein BTVI_97918 [Pitangus sulphuratus]|nr:hypothetical protein BTVI_97918 [Pitangus sulphuratus]